MRNWLNNFIWYHRIRGHDVERGINLFGGSTPYRCQRCQMLWEVYW